MMRFKYGAKGDDFHNHRLVALCVLAFVIVSSLAAFDTAPLDRLSDDDKEAVEAGMVSFEAARMDFWSTGGEGTRSPVLLDAAAGSFETVQDDAARFYLLGRVELYRGRVAIADRDKSGARERLEIAMDLADQSNAAAESSEAWRLKADAGSSWMITKGLGGIIKMAPQVGEWSERALELDRDNALALIINAQGQINAPKGSGGDPPAAVERLVRLSARNDLDQIERFWSHASLAQAYKKVRDNDGARRACDVAKGIFPDNPLVEDCR